MCRQSAGLRAISSPESAHFSFGQHLVYLVNTWSALGDDQKESGLWGRD